jgi:subtilisin family serine protease
MAASSCLWMSFTAGQGYAADNTFQREVRSVPDDPLYAQQWELHPIEVGPATVVGDYADLWQRYQGTGVVIGVVDSGIDYAHEDLAANYSAALSWDFVDNDADPSPGINEDHGTLVAGIAAGRGNNGVGVTGVAPEATFAALRLIGFTIGSVTTDAMEAAALTHRLDAIDIYSNSWGGISNGQSISGPGPLTTAALSEGAMMGRGGRGSIYVFAGGNGREVGDNVNYDGYANNRHTIAVAAIDDQGVEASYSEPGASLLVSAFSSSTGHPGITTTDRTGTSGYNLMPSASGGDYTDNFGGTSAAAPLVSGVVALMLEANPQLTSRDVQHILVHSAAKNDPADSDWVTNGAGLHVNHKYGFGAIDAEAAVNLAETWTSVGPEVSISSGRQDVGQTVPDDSTGGLTQHIMITDEIKLDWVEVVLGATHPARGDLKVELISPSGTSSILADLHDDPNANYYDPNGLLDGWTFTSARCWDELSAGDWTLKISDLRSGNVGTWDSWALNLYGTAVPEPSMGSLLAVVWLFARRRARQGRRIH